jgi:hypothetical protein
MRPILTCFLLMLLTTTASAQSVYFNYFPSYGPPAGGTEVEIFKANSYVRFDAPQVFFGDVPSPRVTVSVVDAFMIRAVAPAHPMGIVTLSLVDRGDRTELGEYVFFRPVEEVIFPIAYKPIVASHGTIWVSEVSVYNDSDEEVPIDSEICYSLGRAFDCRQSARHVPAHESMPIEPWSNYASEPAMNILPPADMADHLHFTLRLRETSRDPGDPGVEIPVLRARDFQKKEVFLPAVTTNPRFRTTIRVLTRAGVVNVRVRDDVTGQVIKEWSVQRSWPTDSDTLGTVTIPDPLTPAEANAHGKVRIQVSADMPVWALITLTDNDTQRVQIFTPQ